VITASIAPRFFLNIDLIGAAPANAAVIAQVKNAQKDLIAAGNIKDLKLTETDSEIKVKVELA